MDADAVEPSRKKVKTHDESSAVADPLTEHPNTHFEACVDENDGAGSSDPTYHPDSPCSSLSPSPSTQYQEDEAWVNIRNVIVPGWRLEVPAQIALQNLRSGSRWLITRWSEEDILDRNQERVPAQPVWQLLAQSLSVATQMDETWIASLPCSEVDPISNSHLCKDVEIAFSRDGFLPSNARRSEKHALLVKPLFSQLADSMTSSSTFDVEIGLMLANTSFATGDITPTVAMWLKDVESKDLKNNYTFSPYHLYEPVLYQSLDWPTVHDRPIGLADMTKSYPHQLRALDWMIKREDGVLGVQSHVEECKMEWELLNYKIGPKLYYSPWLRTIDPEDQIDVDFSEPRGGILADEMGMGKTVEVISLVLSRPCTYVSAYEAKLPQKAPTVLATHLQPPLPADISCYCYANHSKTKYSSYVQCAYCMKWQHTVCVAYDPAQSAYYACPTCGAEPSSPPAPPAVPADAHTRYPIELKTTLIICPDSILPQWESELRRHTKPGALRGCVFTGMAPLDIDQAPANTPTICRAEQFRDYDIVLTTYSVLTDALRRSGAAKGQKKLSRRKPESLKYIAMPTPLTGAIWYRVCFDESQLLADGGTSAAELTWQMRIRHRWAVSGTPISKNVSDLFGLLLFLDIKPYNDRSFFQKTISDPLMRGHMNSLALVQSLLKRVMWRMDKKSAEEIEMPPIEEHVHSVQFSELEKYMYQRRWRFCEQKLNEAKVRQTNGKLKSSDVEKMVDNLWILRMACCHPQLGQQSGLKSLAQGVLSTSAVLKQLIAQARVQAEERLRGRVFHLNALAALAMARKDFLGAAALYRLVLERHPANLNVDNSQTLHARRNLIEALDRLIAQNPDVEAKKALHDEKAALQSQVDLFRTSYIADARNRFLFAVSKYVELVEQYSKPLPADDFMKDDAPVLARTDLSYWIENKDAWWRLSLNLLNVHQVRMLLQRLEADHGKVLPAGALASASALEAYLQRSLNDLMNSTKSMEESLAALAENRTPKDILQNQAPEPSSLLLAARGTCPTCSARKLSASTKKPRYTVKDGHLDAQTCVWHSSQFVEERLGELLVDYRYNGYISVLNSLHAFIMSDDIARSPHFKGAIVAELHQAARANFRGLDLLKQQHLLATRYSTTHLEYTQSGDELNMFETRMTLLDDNDEKAAPVYARAIINEADIPALLEEHSNSLKVTEFELQQQVSQLNYLAKEAEKDAPNQAPESCSICWEPLPNDCMLLSCGHTGCPDCFNKALNISSKCPLCRTHVPQYGGRKIVSRSAEAALPDKPPSADANVSKWGSKFDAIVALVKHESAQNPGEKFLLFSHWQRVLTLVASALEEAGIVVMVPNGNIAQVMDQFRSDAAATVLCLPLSKGSKGANLTCASQVIFVEPSLMVAAESQAIGRIHRLGQTKKMKIHRIYVEGSVEESIYDLSRLRQQERALQAAVGFGVAERESNFLDLDTLERLLRGKPLVSSTEDTHVAMDVDESEPQPVAAMPSLDGDM